MSLAQHQCQKDQVAAEAGPNLLATRQAILRCIELAVDDVWVPIPKKAAR